MKVFILTLEVNDYDQHGEYFVAVFGERPHHRLLTENGVPQNRLRHVLNGGGRVDNEHAWFHLHEEEVQRPPLTDEEIRAHADKHLRYQPQSYEASGVFDLVRAIERKVRGETE